MRFAGRWVALSLVGALSGFTLGCLVELAHRVACGDGYVDRVAGEECDPGDVDSFKHACVDEYGGGQADCDRERCVLIVNDVQCQYCGDEDINEGMLPDLGIDDFAAPGGESGEAEDDVEACDTSNIGGAVCPGGKGFPKCKGCRIDESDCPHYCGDEHEDPGEECQVGGLGSLATTRPCVATGDFTSPVDSGYPQHAYGSGRATCRDCKWDASGCSYCGNGDLDGQLNVVEGVPSPPEWCDGDEIDPETLAAQVGLCLDENGDPSPTLRRNVRCDECYGFIEPEDEPACCVKRGAGCPGPEDPIRCCYEYLHPGDTRHCTDESEFVASFCR